MHRLLGLTLITGLVVLLAYANSQDPKEKQNDAAIAAPRKDKFWIDRHEKFVARAKQGEVDVLFLGDSITQGWENAGKTAWTKTFEPLKAANFGIGGDRTQHVLWRITEGNELEGLQPKVTVLMIGTNNGGSNTAEEIAAGVRAIILQLRQARPDMKLLLLGVFPRSGKQPKMLKDPEKASAAELHSKIKAINDLLARFDDGKNIHYMDIGEKFLDQDGALTKKIMPDFLHLSPKGYEIWATAIEGKVKELLK